MEVIEADAPADLLDAVAALEQRASHPAANAITTAFADENAPRGLDDQSDSEGNGNHTENTHRVTKFTNHRSGIEGRSTEPRISSEISISSRNEDGPWTTISGPASPTLGASVSSR